MGVGTPSNLLECIALGVDMFMCDAFKNETWILFTDEA